MSDPYDQPDVTLARNRARFGTFSWLGQAPQYDQLGPPTEIVYRRFYDGRPLTGEGKATIDTLLHYDEDGHLDGILNTYPFGARNPDGSTLDDPGNVCITIRPDQDTPAGGVRALLITDALRRWPTIIIEVTDLMPPPATGPLDGTVTVSEPGIHGVAPQDGNRRTSHLPKL